jgi:hypothetical protein
MLTAEKISGYELGMRVRVNEKMLVLNDRGRTGTIIALPLTWGRSKGGRGEWLQAKLDGRDHPVKWHHSYFDLIESGALGQQTKPPTRD